jgi:UDP:flavonoid glycosyltransferase YjiC (YdhE family)
MVPSRDHPAPFVMSQTLPRWVNRLSWRLNHFIYDTFFRRLIDRERARLGLPPIRTGVFDHIVWNNLLVASEPSVAGLPPETPGGVAQTGAWFMPEPEELDAELVSFLDAGPPPVYIGFGSMPDKNPLETSRRVLEAVQGAGVRALLSRGWAGLGKIPLPDTVRVIGPTPHGKLFPRCGAVVHHGGAGTTAQAARAGVPQVIVPHLMDQFFWCHRIHKLGLSPPPIHRGKLRAAELSQALRACIEDGAMRERARTFARGMALDGLERAVQAVENGGAARLKAAGG